MICSVETLLLAFIGNRPRGLIRWAPGDLKMAHLRGLHPVTVRR
jgi:hypothetical protein